MNCKCIANAYYQTRNDRFERVNVFQNYDTVTAPKGSVTRSTVKEKTLAVGKERKFIKNSEKKKKKEEFSKSLFYEKFVYIRC